MEHINTPLRQATRFWVKNQPKILLLVIVAGILIYLRTLPYFNILFSTEWAFLFFWLVTLFLFHLQSRASIVVGVGGLVLTGFATILLREDVAIEMANFTYYVMIIAFVQFLREQRHEKK